jgi:hypothetical protein
MPPGKPHWVAAQPTRRLSGKPKTLKFSAMCSERTDFRMAERRAGVRGTNAGPFGINLVVAGSFNGRFGAADYAPWASAAFT